MGEPLTTHEGAKITPISIVNRSPSKMVVSICALNQIKQTNITQAKKDIFPSWGSTKHGEVPVLVMLKCTRFHAGETLFPPLSFPSICELTMTGVHIHVEQLSRGVESRQLKSWESGRVGGHH